jgi:hypothetical protein
VIGKKEKEVDKRKQLEEERCDLVKKVDERNENITKLHLETDHLKEQLREQGYNAIQEFAYFSRNENIGENGKTTLP